MSITPSIVKALREQEFQVGWCYEEPKYEQFCDAMEYGTRIHTTNKTVTTPQ